MDEEEVNMSFNTFDEPDAYSLVCDCHHWTFEVEAEYRLTSYGLALLRAFEEKE